MEKKSITVLAIVLFAVTLTAGLTTLPNKTLALDKPIEVKIANITPKYPPNKSPASMQAAYVAKRLEENSGGRFKVTIYWAASLYKDDQSMWAAIRDNVIQVGNSTGGRMSHEIPEIQLYSLPFVFDNMEHARRFYYGPEGFKPNGGPGSKLYEPLYEKLGYKLITFMPVGFQDFISRKGFLVTPEDFKGVKFRIRQSKLQAEIMEAFGGSAHAIPFMDTYTALSLGTVDAAECPIVLIFGSKWFECGNYMTVSGATLLNTAFMTSPKFYNSLPEDLKKIWNDSWEESNRYYLKILEDMQGKLPSIMKSQQPSLQFRTLSEEERMNLKKLVNPLLDKYREQIPKPFWDAVEATRPK